MCGHVTRGMARRCCYTFTYKCTCTIVNTTFTRPRTFTCTAQHTWRAGVPRHRPTSSSRTAIRPQLTRSMRYRTNLARTTPRTRQSKQLATAPLQLHLTNPSAALESAATSLPHLCPSTSHRQLANMREVISLNGMSLFTPLCFGPRALTASPVSPGEV
jgi:hypothetical protein